MSLKSCELCLWSSNYLLEISLLWSHCILWYLKSLAHVWIINQVQKNCEVSQIIHLIIIWKWSNTLLSEKCLKISLLSPSIIIFNLLLSNICLQDGWSGRATEWVERLKFHSQKLKNIRSLQKFLQAIHQILPKKKESNKEVLFQQGLKNEWVKGMKCPWLLPSAARPF